MSDEKKGTSDQWDLLLDAVEADRELRGIFSGAQAKQRVFHKWNSLANDLNKIGVTKTSAQWKESFNGVKKRARNALAEKQSYMEGTGGGDSYETVEDLEEMGFNSVYIKCLRIIGKVSAVGNRSVPNALQVSRENRNRRCTGDKSSADRGNYNQDKFSTHPEPAQEPHFRSSLVNSARNRGSPVNQVYNRPSSTNYNRQSPGRSRGHYSALPESRVRIDISPYHKAMNKFSWNASMEDNRSPYYGRQIIQRKVQRTPPDRRVQESPVRKRLFNGPTSLKSPTCLSPVRSPASVLSANQTPVRSIASAADNTTKTLEAILSLVKVVENLKVAVDLNTAALRKNGESLATLSQL